MTTAAGPQPVAMRCPRCNAACVVTGARNRPDGRDGVLPVLAALRPAAAGTGARCPVCGGERREGQ